MCPSPRVMSKEQNIHLKVGWQLNCQSFKHDFMFYKKRKKMGGRQKDAEKNAGLAKSRQHRLLKGHPSSHTIVLPPKTHAPSSRLHRWPRCSLGGIKRITIQETGLGWAFASDHWDCMQSSKLIIGGAQDPKLTWSNEKQVKMILAFIYNESVWESSGKSSENLQISDEIVLYLCSFTLLTSI